MSTLKVDTILKRTGTGTITLGQSGDTIALGSGASQTGFGGTNTPYFVARRNSAQTLSNNAYAKVQFDVEVLDSASAFDPSSNYRFTVPSGQAGKYVIGARVNINGVGDGTLWNGTLAIYKNGSIDIASPFNFKTGYINNFNGFVEYIYDASVSDYYEIYVKGETTTSGNPTVHASSGDHGIAKPTDEQLASYDADADKQEQNNQIRATRKAEYGDIGDQLDEIYKDMDAWKTRIAKVKADNPKV
jgi:hypothetical protein